jgi:hypothetical protein
MYKWSDESNGFVETNPTREEAREYNIKLAKKVEDLLADFYNRIYRIKK